MKKRILSLALCIIMLFSMNATAFAAEDTEVAAVADEGAVTFEVTPHMLPDQTDIQLAA